MAFFKTGIICVIHCFPALCPPHTKPQTPSSVDAAAKEEVFGQRRKCAVTHSASLHWFLLFGLRCSRTVVSRQLSQAKRHVWAPLDTARSLGETCVFLFYSFRCTRGVASHRQARGSDRYDILSEMPSREPFCLWVFK